MYIAHMLNFKKKALSIIFSVAVILALVATISGHIQLENKVLKIAESLSSFSETEDGQIGKSLQMFVQDGELML